MTESKRPNEYDQKRWTWMKNWHQRTLTFEHDRKHNKYYHNDEHKRVNIFGQIHTFMFVVVVIFILFSTFGQIYPYFGQVQRLMFVGEKFWSCSNINLRWCKKFSVKVLTNFWSCCLSSELASYFFHFHFCKSCNVCADALCCYCFFFLFCSFFKNSTEIF